MCDVSRTTCCLSLAVLALVAIIQAAPATRDSNIENNLENMFSLIKDLSDTANKLEASLTERQNEEETPNERQNDDNETSESEVLAEELTKRRKPKDSFGRYGYPEPEIANRNNIDEVQGKSVDSGNPVEEKACTSRYCKNGEDSVVIPDDPEKRVDELLKALLMLREMETHEEKRDYDIPFP